MPNHDSLPVAYSWPHGRQLASDRKYGSKVKLPKRSVGPLPNEFEPSSLSIKGTAKAAYRSPGPAEHYQVREYDDYWTIEMDRAHPKHNPIAHAVQDAPGYTLLGGIAAAAVFGNLG